MHVPVAVPTQAHEVVVLRHDLAGWPREVDLEHRHVAAQIGDVEDQVVRELRRVPPQRPAHAEGGETELVPRGADRLHPRDAEVPHDVGGAEGGQEGTAGAVDVDVDVETGLLLQLVERLGELEHGLVGPGVGDAEGRHHHDGVLVDPFEHLLDVHLVAPRGHRDLPHLDVPVLGELVPDHLHGPAHHVGRVGRLPGGPALGPPTPLGRHPAQHARLRGPDGRAADGLLGVGRVPQVGQHVDAAPFQLGRLGVLVLVDEVLVDAEVHQVMDLWLLPRLAERGEVLAGIAVEHELVGDRLHHLGRPHLRSGTTRRGQRRLLTRVGVDRVDQLLPGGLPLVQRHHAPPIGSLWDRTVPYRAVAERATDAAARARRVTGNSSGVRQRGAAQPNGARARRACAVRRVRRRVSWRGAAGPTDRRARGSRPAEPARGPRRCGRSRGGRPASNAAGEAPLCGSGTPCSR